MEVLWLVVVVAFAWMYRILQRVEARNREEEARNREELARNREEIAVLRSRSNRLLSLDALESARRSVFMLSLESSGAQPVGVGVFYQRGQAVTAAHNLQHAAPRAQFVYGAFGKRAGGTDVPPLFRLRVVSRDDELDVAVLVCDNAYRIP